MTDSSRGTDPAEQRLVNCSGVTVAPRRRCRLVTAARRGHDLTTAVRWCHDLTTAVRSSLGRRTATQRHTCRSAWIYVWRAHSTSCADDRPEAAGPSCRGRRARQQCRRGRRRQCHSRHWRSREPRRRRRRYYRSRRGPLGPVTLHSPYSLAPRTPTAVARLCSPRLGTTVSPDSARPCHPTQHDRVTRHVPTPSDGRGPTTAAAPDANEQIDEHDYDT